MPCASARSGSGRTRAAHVTKKEIAQGQIAELVARIEELEDMRRTLEHLTQACRGNDLSDCPSLNDLAGSEAVPVSLDK
jgi:hypothetical protein